MPILDCYPKFYQDWLFTALELTAGEETKADVLEPLFAMNRAWRDGGTLPADYFAELATLRAYSLYYMTINMPKLWFLLSRAGIPPAGTLVDLGSGPGNAGLGLAVLSGQVRARAAAKHAARYRNRANG